MEAPRGVEPTGTNGRTRHTFRSLWVGSRPVVVSFVGWQGALFLVVTETILVRRFVRVRCPVPGPPRSESVVWLVSVPPVRWFPSDRCIGFAVVMAQVRRPVPFRTRKLRPGRGDGTALERVWESSTPPHSTYGPSGRAPSGSRKVLFISAHGVSSSIRWRKTDAGRPVGGRIVPVTGGFGTLGDPRNFRGASCPYPMVE